MANYTLTSPLAVHSTSSVGKINLFSAGSANSIELQPPATLPSSLTFTLPNSTPSASGAYLRTNGAGVLSWATRGGFQLQFPINRRTFTNSTVAVTSTSATLTIADYVELFDNGNGSISTDIYAIISATNNTTTIRIQIFNDAFGGSILLDATSGTLVANTPTIFFVGSIPAASFANSIVAAQVRIARAAGAGTVSFWGYQIIAV